MLNDRGFTIVEVLVALLVLSVGLVGVLSTLASAIRTFTDANSSVQVAASASAVLERIRVAGCEGASTGFWAGTAVSYTWEIEEVAPQLERVKVLIGSNAVRARIDTFSATLPC